MTVKRAHRWARVPGSSRRFQGRRHLGRMCVGGNDCRGFLIKMSACLVAEKWHTVCRKLFEERSQ